jgi:hypothetical protein
MNTVHTSETKRAKNMTLQLQKLAKSTSPSKAATIKPSAKPITYKFKEIRYNKIYMSNTGL